MVLRGYVWYRGSKYNLGNFSGLCTQTTLEDTVRSLHLRDPFVSLPALERHGLGPIISPSTTTTWTESSIRLSRRAGGGFGFSPEESSDPRGGAHGTTWKLLRVEEDSAAWRAGLRQGWHISAIEGHPIGTIPESLRRSWILNITALQPVEEVHHWQPRESPYVEEEPTDLEPPAPHSKPVGKPETRSGQKYRNIIDKCLSWNVDTLRTSKDNSSARQPDGTPLRPGALEEHLYHCKEQEYGVVAMQGHRWAFTGALFGRVQSFKVFVAGARKQGAPEGLLLAFGEKWNE